MRIPRFYQPEALPSGTTITLNDNAARHAINVLRLHIGAPLELFDGHGNAFAARLEQRNPARVRIIEAHPVSPTPALNIELMQALSRSTKMDWVIQKAVELGASVITPVTAARSVLRVDAKKAEKKRTHWHSIAVSACEQCGRNWLPTIHAPTALNKALTSNTGAALKLMLDGEAPASSLAASAPSHTRVLIGPEGGLTAAEKDLAVAAGFTPVRLGPRVLRTETAAIVSLAVLQYQWGDLQ